MKATRIGGAALLLLTACTWERKPMEETILSYENLSPREVQERIRPRLSERGTMAIVGDGRVRIIDYHENVSRAARALGNADRSPFTAVLQFQLIHGTLDGPVDEPTVQLAAALRDLVRFRGFSVIGEQTIAATEGESEESNMEMRRHRDQYEVEAEVNDIRASNTREGSVELTVRLRREGKSNMLNTNVVVPIGQSVVLGVLHPDSEDEAVLLVVRPELDVAEPSQVSRLRVRVGSHDAGNAAVEAAHAVEAVQHEIEKMQEALVHEELARAGQELAKAGQELAKVQRLEQIDVLIQTKIDQLRIQFEQGGLTREEFDRARREALAERSAVRQSVEDRVAPPAAGPRPTPAQAPKRPPPG